MAFNFVSPGAAMADALRAHLVEQETRRRQKMFDDLKMQEAADARADRELSIQDRARGIKRQETADARIGKVESQQDADRLARVLGPDADLTGNTNAIETFERGGYAIDKPTLAATSIDGMTTAAPTAVPEGEQAAAPVAPTGPKLPGIVMPSRQSRAETAIETQARKVREEQAAEKVRDREFREEMARQAAQDRKDLAESANRSREEIARMAAEQRAAAAQAALANARTSQEVAQARLEIQQSLADLKIAEAGTKRDEKAIGIANTRGTIRDLAKSLIDDPNLDSITGALDSRTYDLLPGSVDAARRWKQLESMLSLEARTKLQGQGAVSDFETKMLTGGTSALDRAAGSKISRKHLQSIVDAFMGDKPRYGPTTAQPTQPAPGNDDLGADF